MSNIYHFDYNRLLWVALEPWIDEIYDEISQRLYWQMNIAEKEVKLRKKQNEWNRRHFLKVGHRVTCQVDIASIGISHYPL